MTLVSGVNACTTPPSANRRSPGLTTPHVDGFNPHPVAGRRCLLTLVRYLLHHDVSIHASRCREAMLSGSYAIGTLRQFQSTPPVAGRRCSQWLCADARSHPVSIHASRCREAMHPVRLQVAHGRACFNPRLPLPGGDAGVCWETGLGMAFQSTPPVAGRRCNRRGAWPFRLVCFNPRLPLPGGDAWHARRAGCAKSRFNPRLPLPGGDAAAVAGDGAPNRSFNPRLPLPGGDAMTPFEFWRAMVMFQSTPPVAGRRCRRGFSWPTPCNRFNPRLPLPGGDAQRIGANPLMVMQFQSTPPVAGRRCET